MSRKVTALRAAADKARMRGDQAELARLYVELERHDPGEPEWPKRAADAYQRLRQPTEEFEALLRAAQSYSEAGFLLKAVAVCKRILRLDPNHTETQMQLAELHSGRRRGLQRVGRHPERVAAQSPHITAPSALIPPRAAADPTPAPPLAASPQPRAPSVSEAAARAANPKPATAARSAPRASAGRVRDQSKRLMDALRRERLASAAASADGAAPVVAPTPAAAPVAPRAPVATVEYPVRHSSIPPSAALETVNLAAMMPITRRLTPPGGLAIYEINLDDIELDPHGDVQGAGRPVPNADVHAPDPRLPPGAAEAQGSVTTQANEAPREAAPPLAPMALELGELEQAALPPPRPRVNATLRHLPLFTELDPRTLARLIQQVELREVAAGEVIYAVGDAADRLFVVVRGEVTLLGTPPNLEFGSRHDNEFFGELGVINGAPRPTTAVAHEPTELLVIDRKLLSALAAEEPSVLTVLLRFIRERLVHSLILTSPLFANYDASEAHALAARFHFLEVVAGATLLSPDQRADGLYVLLSGTAELSVRGEVVQDLAAGDVFGEESLLSNAEPAVGVTTSSKCFALRLDARDFREVIMTHPPVLVYLSELADARKSARAGLFSEPPPPCGRVDLS